MKDKKSKFSDKYGPDEKPDPEIRARILKETREDALPCAVAFKIAADLGVEPSEVGKAADLMEYRLVKCQLGLFGYKPDSSILTPATPEDPAVVDAVKKGLVDGRLPCKTAWKIAAGHNVRKMPVSAACEALGIKIKPCQLGAF